MNTFDTANQCVRILLYEMDQCEDYPYSIFGTGFLLSYGQRVFAVSAKHSILGNKISDLPQHCGLRILFRYGSRDFIPLLPGYSPVSAVSEHSDAHDFIFFEVDTARISVEDVAALNMAQLEPALVTQPISPGAKLYFVGYPLSLKESNCVLYDKQAIPLQRQGRLGSFVGESELVECLKMSLPKREPNMLNGFSGSPVFRVITDVTSEPKVSLCGVLLRGDESVGWVHFTPAIHLVWSLDQYIGGRPEL